MPSTKKKQTPDSLKHIVSLCKRRGFIFHGSEIYGGFANTYSYGPYGTELKKNIKDLWWKSFVQSRRDVVGLDGPILLHPKAWKASGHLEGFNDALIDCKECKARFRADHIVEEVLGLDIDGCTLNEINALFEKEKISCPRCDAQNFTKARFFNLMFQTQIGKISADDVTYLRPETAQAIFLDYKNILDTMRVKLPFGIAQIGKAFRNEITPGNFIFRVIEFEQMEIEYFIRPNGWQEHFETWLKAMHQWCDLIGLKKGHVHEKEHSPDKLSHYSRRTVDLTYDFPFGTQELYGLAYRTDFDLKRHMEHADANLEYRDLESGERFIPHVIEPTFGLDRTILAVLCEAFDEEQLENGETRIVLHLKSSLAPIKVGVFPLMKKAPLGSKAKEVFEMIKNHWHCEYDESGAIGKRYRRQDELGTPFCVTIDYDTIEDGTVTLRERDSMLQIRVPIKSLTEELRKRLAH